MVEQRLLQRLQRGEIPLVKAGEALADGAHVIFNGVCHNSNESRPSGEEFLHHGLLEGAGLLPPLLQRRQSSSCAKDLSLQAVVLIFIFYIHAIDTETSPDACPLAFARMTISTSRSSSVRKRSRRSDENRISL